MGNPTPVFGACGVRLLATPRILQEKHLKLRVGNAARTLDALGWGWAARTSVASSRPERGHGLHRRTKQLSGHGQPATYHQGSCGNRRNGEFVATRGLGLERARRQKWLTAFWWWGISLTALAVGLTYWRQFDSPQPAGANPPQSRPGRQPTAFRLHVYALGTGPPGLYRPCGAHACLTRRASPPHWKM